MNAARCRCGNGARYINSLGELTCSLCPLKHRMDSIRLADVPALLTWARVWAANSNPLDPEVAIVRSILGKDVSRDPQ